MTTAVTSPPGVVPGLARAWVRLYCTGMSTARREVRQLEIESDLWEHFADRTAEGVSPALTSVETVSRLLRGVPSDIAWRFQAEGFHVNISFPVERIAGILLLFLIIPFVAGTAISGYDTGASGWQSEFERFADMSSRARGGTGFLHGAIGFATLAGVAILYTSFRDRSARLIALACTFLLAAGLIMLVNAAIYRSMSALADEYRISGDLSLARDARALALVLEALAMANAAATTSGLLALGGALVRLRMVPRWTLALPAMGALGPILWIVLGSVFPDGAWFAIGIAFMTVALWLLICGVWLLFGGSAKYPPVPSEAPA